MSKKYGIKKNKKVDHIVEKNINRPNDACFLNLNNLLLKKNCLLQNEKISNLNDKKLIKMMSKLNENFEKNEMRIKVKEIKDKIEKQWTLLSSIIDRLLLFIFIFLTFFILGSIVNQVSYF